MSSATKREPTGNEPSLVYATNGVAVGERASKNKRGRPTASRRCKFENEQTVCVMLAFHCSDVPDGLRSGARAEQRAHRRGPRGSGDNGFLGAVLWPSLLKTACLPCASRPGRPPRCCSVTWIWTWPIISS